LCRRPIQMAAILFPAESQAFITRAAIKPPEVSRSAFMAGDESGRAYALAAFFSCVEDLSKRKRI